jgi:hypothetical protein
MKLIQAGVPTLDLDVPAWKISQWRIRAKFPETRAAAVTELIARGLPVPELITTVDLAPDGEPHPPHPWPAGYVEEQNRLWQAAHGSKEETSN